MVTFRRFQQFIAVAEELSFRRAAERLHMAQPPLTSAIQKLEAELGTELFIRRGRQIELTTAGAMFLEEARLVMSQVERAVGVGRAVASGMTGSLRVGYTASTSFEFMPRVLKAFRAERSEIRLNLYEYPTWNQLEEIRAKRLDVGLLRPPPAWPAGIGHEILFRERLVALIPTAHRLSRKPHLELKDLKDEPIVLFSHTWANRHREQILTACTMAGFSPMVAQETEGLLAVVSFVASGVGIGFGPTSLKNIRQHDIVYRDIRDPSDQLYFDLAVAWYEERQLPVARSFIDVTRRVARNRRSA